jgi:hypothetical protein
MIDRYPARVGPAEFSDLGVAYVAVRVLAILGLLLALL